MTLSTTITSSIKIAIDALGDLANSVIHIPIQPYDPVTGLTPDGVGQTFISVVGDVETSSFKNTLAESGRQVIYLLPDTSKTDPKVGDVLVDNDGIRWSILDINPIRSHTVVFLWELLVKS